MNIKTEIETTKAALKGRCRIESITRLRKVARFIHDDIVELTITPHIKTESIKVIEQIEQMAQDVKTQDPEFVLERFEFVMTQYSKNVLVPWIHSSLLMMVSPNTTTTPS